MCMKRILIYGDSNLWGLNSSLNKRYEDENQWSNMLGKYLGNEYVIIQEGLPGRIAGNFNFDQSYKNGKDTFETIFKSCAPIDYIIIALGTNDLLKRYNRKAQDIYNDLMWYKEKVNEIYNIPKYRERYFNNNIPDFIYVLSSNFDYNGYAKDILNDNSNKQRIKLIKLFKNNPVDKYVELNNIDLIKNDGIHYSVKGQRMVYNEVKKLF